MNQFLYCNFEKEEYPKLGRRNPSADFFDIENICTNNWRAPEFQDNF